MAFYVELYHETIKGDTQYLMKMLLQVVQRRIDLMEKEGILFKAGVQVGKDVPAKQLLAENDAVLLCLGSTWPRGLPIPGK